MMSTFDTGGLTCVGDRFSALGCLDGPAEALDCLEGPATALTFLDVPGSGTAAATSLDGPATAFDVYLAGSAVFPGTDGSGRGCGCVDEDVSTALEPHSCTTTEGGSGLGCVWEVGGDLFHVPPISNRARFGPNRTGEAVVFLGRGGN